MSFDLVQFFGSVFRPEKGEIVTVMYDLPHGEIADNPKWEERRGMAEEWCTKLSAASNNFGITVNPVVTYDATGGNNADLPATGLMDGKNVQLDDVIKGSTIIVAMPEFSATAPLYNYSMNSNKLRVGSMPGVNREMEETGLSADYAGVSEMCKMLAPNFEKAVGAEVEFSSGHKCYFDLSDKNHAHMDDGILHPEKAGTDASLSNLPAGEVYVVPNESKNSKTAGELPEKRNGGTVVYVVQNNRHFSVLPAIQRHRDLQGSPVELIRGSLRPLCTVQLSQAYVRLRQGDRVAAVELVGKCESPAVAEL